MFSGLVAQSSTSRCSATHNWNGLCNLAYFLLGFTFPEGQKKTNKDWRSCFSSQLAGGGLSSGGCHVSLWGGWRGAGGVRFGWLEVFTADSPSRETLLCFSLSGSRTLFRHLLTQLVWGATLRSSYQPAMHIPMTLQQCHNEAAAAHHRYAAIHCMYFTHIWSIMAS